jgi:dCMP deaminase
MRPSQDEYYMNIAKVVATRSTCVRRQIGTVLVRYNSILATGYNGAPRGLPHCIDVGCIREQLNIPSGTQHERCQAIHSEVNAILQCALHGISTKGAILYCTNQPCSICARIIINAGISRIIYEGSYPDEATINLFKQANIPLVKMQVKPFIH